MSVSDAVAQWLIEKGITHAFGIVGGGNYALWDAITRAHKTRIVCCHHEQAAAMASAYFNRTANRLGSVALITTGGGSTNAITGVAAAWMDRVPLLILSGNESSKYLASPGRTKGTQGFDSCALAAPVSKAAARVLVAHMALPTLDGALADAMRPPQGPVWVDIPADIQRHDHVAH